MQQWDRLEGEPARDYAAFARYLHDRRPLTQQAREARRNESELDEARRRWSWDARRDARDAFLSELRAGAEQEALAYLAGARVRAARGAYQIAVAWEKKAAWYSEQAPEHVDGRELARHAAIAQRERIVPAPPPAPAPPSPSEDFDQFTTEELLVKHAWETIQEKKRG